ncbi:MAG TPA: DUF58 domain-containing protein [Thermoplasmata archaeon]|nr:DUF58 domain-containing protein [Thermoplasmata archaeon]
MITRRGWEALLSALKVLLVALFTLHYLLVLLGVVAATFLVAEVLLFHLDTRGLSSGLFLARRTTPIQRHAVGSVGRTTVEVSYRGRAGIVAEAFDTLPDGLEILGPEPTTHGWWGPGEARALSTGFLARIRGSYLVGPTVVVVRSRLGLAERRVALPTERPLQVVPENPVRKPGQLRRRIFTRVQGRMQLRHRGYGTEFRSLRPYQYSDDIRHVAWRRSTPKRLVVREFEQESRQDVVLVLDVSPAMLAGEAGENVLDRAAEAATLIAGYAQRGGEDRLGLLTYSGRVRQFLRPSRGPAHFRRLMQNIALVRPHEGEFRLPGALDGVGERLRYGAHILLFSALERPLEGLHRSHARFRARGHHLYVFVPDLSSFYRPPSDPTFARALSWASEEDRLRRHRALAELRAEAIPAYTFDQRGAAPQVITAYGQMRTWGGGA